MQKKNKIPVALILTGAVTVGAIKTAECINDIKGSLAVANEQIEELKKDNSSQKEVIDSLNKDLKIYIKENLALEDSNKDLKSQVESLEKKLQQEEFPTGKIKKTSRVSGTPIQMTMTFYGDFAHENGGYAGVDCNGNKLVGGTVASNYYPQGTQFEFNGQIFTVRDRGGSNFNSPNRLDVFVPRLKNESNSSYSARIKEYGRRTVTMYMR